MVLLYIGQWYRIWGSLIIQDNVLLALYHTSVYIYNFTALIKTQAYHGAALQYADYNNNATNNIHWACVLYDICKHIYLLIANNAKSVHIHVSTSWLGLNSHSLSVIHVSTSWFGLNYHSLSVVPSPRNDARLAKSLASCCSLRMWSAWIW